MLVDWNSEKTHLFLNPRMPQEQKLELKDLPLLKGHLWVTTSGSNALKYVALSKVAILLSAESVNRHLGIQKEDVWMHVLPDFHVGGIGIWARSFLSGSKVVKLDSWNPELFIEQTSLHQGTIVSLVPTHLFDLVAKGFTAPSSLRCVIIGGGAISDALFQRAKKLGWPIVASYGMTECCSQVATATLDSPQTLRLLSHMQVKCDPEGRIAIKSPSLCTKCVKKNGDKWECFDPKEEGWFFTEDKGEMNQGILKVYGRDSHFVKIGGENVNLHFLNQILEEVKISLSFSCDAFISAINDERLGKTIQLITTSHDRMDEMIFAFNTLVHPFEKIRSVRQVEIIPKTPLMKVKH